MARPKGSKNKKTEKEKPVKTEPKKESAIYTPKCASCGHAVEMHYGSDLKWCNISGCPCNELK